MQGAELRSVLSALSFLLSCCPYALAGMALKPGEAAYSVSNFRWPWRPWEPLSGTATLSYTRLTAGVHPQNREGFQQDPWYGTGQLRSRQL